jgi:hypothetical protein
VPPELPDLPKEESPELPTDLGSESARRLSEKLEKHTSKAERAFTLSPAMKKLMDDFNAPLVKQAGESMKRLTDTLGLDSLKQLEESSERLKKLVGDTSMQGSFSNRMPDLGPLLNYTPPDVKAVSILQDLHETLTEQARQQSVLVEATQANLTATKALIIEEQIFPDAIIASSVSRLTRSRTGSVRIPRWRSARNPGSNQPLPSPSRPRSSGGFALSQRVPLRPRWLRRRMDRSRTK